ncbi:protein of unknown function [Pricia antarctica]|uniref:3-keto-alpha-glucoside-1,2-lyase/3-keto-2-hydroxy-glucal hydratase domain-containing protein n=2 Tax=Pricia antarctica TaxID=641691 RepID=A0A1G7C0S6_9FLAO|nr:protein of unknown function [Pricia antarctica]
MKFEIKKMKKSKLNIPLQMLFTISLCFVLQACGENKKDKTTEKPEVATNEDKDGFTTIFDGKTLEGWEGDPTYWSVKNGNLTGEVTPETLLKNNTFIIWQGGQPDDFELKLDVKIAETGNSGINYRSEQIDTIPHALRGYQADIDGKNTYTGQNYEERKRTTLAYRGEKVIIHSQDNPEEAGSLRANVQKNCWQSREVVASLGESDSLKTKINSEDWNKIHLIVKGNRLQHYVNGVLMSDVTDDDAINRKSSGYLGVQVHVGPPMTVEYRNIRLKNL